ncbi:MAG TPA: protein translocase subunit SecD [Hyphomicrobiaceae bacterium]
MLHFQRWKIIAITLTCLAGVLLALPNLFSKETLQSWPDWLPKRQLSLGLDLRGGAHLLLAMDVNDVRKDWLDTIRDDARARLREARIGVTGLGVQGGAVHVRIAQQDQVGEALTKLKGLVQPIGNALLGSAGDDISVERGAEPNLIILQPTEAGMQQRISNAIAASIETVRRRIDTLGTSEASVVRQGADRILVQFPGLQDTTQLKALIGETARLSFHEVHPSMSGEEALASRPPPGYKVYPSAEQDGFSYLLRETPVVRGDQLVDAQPGFDQRTNQPIITFRFDQSGARTFGRFTQEHVGRPFAIVLDDKVLSAPVIQEPILGGSGQISGNFTVESANNLAIQLRSGALPAKLTIVEERTVGPSLGADSIESGTRAFIVGGLATFVLITVVYGTFGFYAGLALIINAILILACMTLLGAALTLPGIAGLVLTLGMAVDANVLIYERIREEIRAGKSAIAAIDAGFTRAIVTIADSQLTTLVAAIIMFWLGSGPIRGFAVTLSIGIFTSVFTAVTVTRLLIALWVRSIRHKSRTVEVPV